MLQFKLTQVLIKVYKYFISRTDAIFNLNTQKVKINNINLLENSQF